MENIEVKEENLAHIMQQQKENLVKVLEMSEKILLILRGTKCKQENEDMKEDCIFDTCYINSNLISQLEINLNEMARKIIG